MQNKAARDCLTTVITILDREDHERQKLKQFWRCDCGNIYPVTLEKCPECGGTDRCRAEDCYRK